VKYHCKKFNLFSKDIDKEIGQLNKIINKEYTSSCPVKYASKQYPTWWNKELAKLWKNSRNVFNQCYASKIWQPYKDSLKAYEQALYKTKNNSWAKYCEAI